MLDVHQLRDLLNFSGDDTISTTDMVLEEECAQLERMGLLVNTAPCSRHTMTARYMSTAKALKVIIAAVRAANEELASTNAENPPP
jgi:hypothetical protein